MRGLWSEPLRTNEKILMAERLAWGQLDFWVTVRTITTLPDHTPTPILPPKQGSIAQCLYPWTTFLTQVPKGHCVIWKRLLLSLWDLDPPPN